MIMIIIMTSVLIVHVLMKIIAIMLRAYSDVVYNDIQITGVTNSMIAISYQQTKIRASRTLLLLGVVTYGNSPG